MPPRIEAPGVIRSSCPLCKRELVTSWQEEDIPFFGEILLISASCSCGFKYADTLILGQREPVRYEMRIRESEDLNARVIRSSSGTIRIPELGIDVEPGPASESYVSNIEGVLCRIQEVVGMVSRWDEEEKRRRAEEILLELEKVKAGRRELTVILEDPLGNSAIISEKARRSSLSQEEASRLKTGAIVFGLSNL